MSFSDILKRPLPSQSLYTESEDEAIFDDPNALKKQLDKEVSEDVDDDTLDSYASDDDYDSYASDDSDSDELDYDDECGSNCDDGYDECGDCKEDVDLDDDDIDDIADELEDIDDEELENLSDEELSRMEDELENQEIDNLVGDPEQVDLDPEEEKVADDLMSVSATTEILKDELNAEERAKFYESARDTQIAVYEGFLLESDIENGRADSDDDLFTEAKMWNKTTVRFSKNDRKRQLYSVAVNVSARAHNDPMYFKYQKILKARRLYKRKLEKKYHNEAIKRMKVYFNRLRKSKSSILSDIGKKLSK